MPDGALYVITSHDTDELDHEHTGDARQFRMRDYRLMRALRPDAPLQDLGTPYLRCGSITPGLATPMLSCLVQSSPLSWTGSPSTKCHGPSNSCGLPI
jgi:hypothetical protein